MKYINILDPQLNGGHIKEDNVYLIEQGKSEGFDSCNRPSNLTQIGFKLLIFQPV